MKIRIIILYCLVILLFIGCTQSNIAKPELSSLEGTIVMIGNEPFAKLALQTREQKVYIIKCSSEIYSKLLQKQGYTIIAKYSGTENTAFGVSINVIEFSSK